MGAELTKQQLQQLLHDAEQREKVDRTRKNFEEIRSKYEGKSWGTHTFTRRSRASFKGAVYFERIFLEDDNVKAMAWRISANTHDYDETNIGKTFQYSSYKGISQFGNEGHDISNAIPGYYGHREELTVEKFMSLWKAVEQIEPILRNSFETTLDNPVVVEKTFNVDREDEEFLHRVKAMGMSVIDVQADKELWRVLHYTNMPFLFRQRWLDRSIAKRVLQNQITFSESKHGMGNWEANIIKAYLAREFDA